VAGHFSCTFEVILVFCRHWGDTILTPFVKSALDRDHSQTHHYDLHNHQSKLSFLSPSLSLPRHIEPCTKTQFLDRSGSVLLLWQGALETEVEDCKLHCLKLLTNRALLHLFKGDGKMFHYAYPYWVVRSYRSFRKCPTLRICI